MNRASLVVFDLKGQEMSRQTLEVGTGTTQINTSKWTAGVYVYTIEVDGRTLARKKMVVQ
jgi:hypothetical protein